MIDYLISDKKLVLKRICILKYMKFLISRGFSRIFLKFSEIFLPLMGQLLLMGFLSTVDRSRM